MSEASQPPSPSHKAKVATRSPEARAGSSRARWAALPAANRTFQQLVERLCSKELALQNRETSVEALIAKSGVRNRAKDRRDSDSPLSSHAKKEPPKAAVRKDRPKHNKRIETRICRICQRRGHIARNCRSKERQATDRDQDATNMSCSLSSEACFSGGLTSDQAKGEEWLLDSGATRHMCNRREYFVNLKPLNETGTVIVANSQKLAVEGVGDISVQSLAISR